jgi:septal ring factor EnvC (AmiA/AmiB activator)
VFFILAQSPINLLTLESGADFLYGSLVHYPFFLSFLFFFFWPIQKSLKQEHFLWQLSNIEKDIEKISEELEDEMKGREDVIKDLEKYEREAGKKKKEQSKYSKEITQLEKKIAERSNKLDKNVSL